MLKPRKRRGGWWRPCARAAVEAQALALVPRECTRIRRIIVCRCCVGCNGRRTRRLDMVHAVRAVRASKRIISVGHRMGLVC